MPVRRVRDLKPLAPARDDIGELPVPDGPLTVSATASARKHGVKHPDTVVGLLQLFK
jgi:hypothetical protein